MCRNPFLIRSVIPTWTPLREIEPLPTGSQSLLNQVSDSYTKKGERKMGKVYTVKSQSLLNQVSDSYRKRRKKNGIHKNRVAIPS